MKKEASVILAKCAQDKLYGIRIEKRDNDWVRTWAFKLKEETAEKEAVANAATVAETLLKLKQLYDAGVLTEEEYAGKREKLIEKL